MTISVRYWFPVVLLVIGCGGSTQPPTLSPTQKTQTDVPPPTQPVDQEPASTPLPTQPAKPCVLQTQKLTQELTLLVGLFRVPVVSITQLEKTPHQVSLSIPVASKTASPELIIKTDHLELTGSVSEDFSLYPKQGMVIAEYVIPSAFRWKMVDPKTNRIPVERPLIPSRFGEPRSVNADLLCTELSLEAPEKMRTAHLLSEKAITPSPSPTLGTLWRAQTPLKTDLEKAPVATLHSTGFTVVTVHAKQNAHALVTLTEGEYTVFGWVDEEAVDKYKSKNTSETAADKTSHRNSQTPTQEQTTTCDHPLPLFAVKKDSPHLLGTLAKGTPMHIIDSNESHASISLPEDPWLAPLEGITLAIETTALESCTLPEAPLNGDQ